MSMTSHTQMPEVLFLHTVLHRLVLSALDRVPPVRSINPSLMQKMSRQDFLGYVPNTR